MDPGLDNVLGNADDLTLTDATDADGAYQIGGLPAGPTLLSVDVTTLPGLVNTSDPELAIVKTAIGTFPSGSQAQHTLRVTNADPSAPDSHRHRPTPRRPHLRLRGR